VNHHHQKKKKEIKMFDGESVFLFKRIDGLGSKWGGGNVGEGDFE
jgi:hypothetical protein